MNIIDSGYKLQFNTPPFQNSPVLTNPSPAKLAIIQPLVSKLLDSGAISVIEPSNDQHVYRIFTVKKKNGKDRLIIDLSPLNNLIKKIHFRMEDFEFIKSLLNVNDYLASIDLSDAFFSIPLHQSSKKYVCFQLENTRYCFNVLPFGLTSSPRIFSKVLKVAITFLRSKGIKMSFYLDDIIIVSSSPSLLQQHVAFTVKFLSNLGFFINFEKSSLNPSRSITHLGYVWNSAEFNLSVPPDKVIKVKNSAIRLLNSSVSIRDVSSFLGLLISLTNAFPLAPLYFRKLQLCFLENRSRTPHWDDYFNLDDGAIADLNWWSTCSSCLSPASLHSFEYSISLYTDSSNLGWGATLSNGMSTSGLWSEEIANNHINFLELKCIHLAFLALLPHLKNRSVRLLSDNIVSVFYINKIGGTHSFPLCLLSLDIWQLFLDNNIQCKAFHIPGSANCVADFLSRSHARDELVLSHNAFNLLSSCLDFPLYVDLFASRFSCKLPQYVSQFPDNNAWKIDAFSFSWPDNLYIFPPIKLISKVLQKFKTDSVSQAILLTPAWPSLPSLPIIFELLFSDPILIPVFYFEGQFPTRRPFDVMAWPISSLSVKRTAFQKTLSQRSAIASVQVPSKFMQEFGRCSTVGSLALNVLPQSLPP